MAETFMMRLAVVLIVSGFGASGYAIIMPPRLGSWDSQNGRVCFSKDLGDTKKTKFPIYLYNENEKKQW